MHLQTGRQIRRVAFPVKQNALALSLFLPFLFCIFIGHGVEGTKSKQHSVVQRRPKGLETFWRRNFADRVLQQFDEPAFRNIQACNELSGSVRTSFGPNGSFMIYGLHYCCIEYIILKGSNKLIINHLGKLFVTSDAATIIREIEVVHPAAKLLVMASQAQESEVSMHCIAFRRVSSLIADLLSDGRLDKSCAHPCRRTLKTGRAFAHHGATPKRGDAGIRFSMKKGFGGIRECVTKPYCAC